MSGYDYVNGCYVVHTDIRPRFKRFHKCNAQYNDFLLNDNGITRWHIYQFVSYATEIMQVTYDMNYGSFIVSCNGNPYGYSQTTTRQVSRWIRENCFPFDASDILEALELCYNVTPDIASYRVDDNITVDFHAWNTFHNVWR